MLSVDLNLWTINHVIMGVECTIWIYFDEQLILWHSYRYDHEQAAHSCRKWNFKIISYFTFYGGNKLWCRNSVLVLLLGYNGPQGIVVVHLPVCLRMDRVLTQLWILGKRWKLYINCLWLGNSQEDSGNAKCLLTIRLPMGLGIEKSWELHFGGCQACKWRSLGTSPSWLNVFEAAIWEGLNAFVYNGYYGRIMIAHAILKYDSWCYHIYVPRMEMTFLVRFLMVDSSLFTLHHKWRIRQCPSVLIPTLPCLSVCLSVQLGFPDSFLTNLLNLYVTWVMTCFLWITLVSTFSFLNGTSKDVDTWHSASDQDFAWDCLLTFLTYIPPPPHYVPEGDLVLWCVITFISQIFYFSSFSTFIPELKQLECSSLAQWCTLLRYCLGLVIGDLDLLS